MSQDELDQRWREAARSYHEPPETPREEMWARIRAARTARRRPRVPAFPGRWVPWAAAAAALLVLGIGIGRLTVNPGAAGTASWEGPSVNTTTYRLAAQEHLSQAEAFLTLFRTSLEQPGQERLASATARRLLASNRLLLDSPAALEPATRLLLEDLELVLAGIAQLSPGSRDEDLKLIQDGLERGDVMPRLRTAVPAGAAPNQGAL